MTDERELKPDTLSESAFILFEEGFTLNALILDSFRAKAISRHVATRSGQIAFIFELVAAGLGIAFLPKGVAELRPHPNVRLVPLAESKCKWHIALAWWRGGDLAEASRAWL